METIHSLGESPCFLKAGCRKEKARMVTFGSPASECGGAGRVDVWCSVMASSWDEGSSEVSGPVLSGVAGWSFEYVPILLRTLRQYFTRKEYGLKDNGVK